MAKYTLEMQDDACGDETREIEQDTQPTVAECEAECEDWARNGEWGEDGASISVWWTLNDEDGDEVDSGSTTVEIEPDHSALIGKATYTGFGQHAGCGDDPDDHDWTSEGEGGCDQNPGVWSTGGTSMSFAHHCRKCGLHRTSHSTGSQCNPGEHDTVKYEMPESWCEECQSEDCKCKYDLDALVAEMDRVCSEQVDDSPRDWGHGTEAGHIGHTKGKWPGIGWYCSAGNSGHSIFTIHPADVDMATELLEGEDDDSNPDLKALLDGLRVDWDV